jgi:hypothetical protein
MWFSKCCLPFTYIGGPKGKNFILQNRTFYFWGASIILFFLSDGQIGSLQKNKKKKKEKKKRKNPNVFPIIL